MNYTEKICSLDLDRDKKMYTHNIFLLFYVFVFFFATTSYVALLLFLFSSNAEKNSVGLNNLTVFTYCFFIKSL